MLGTSKNIWGFDPRSVPGCQLWLDGADTSSMTLSGSNVTQWNDKSGSSNHFTPTSGTPTSISDNGRNVVNFTSGAIMTSTNQITFTTSSAFFIVSRLTSISGSGLGMLLGFTNIANGGGGPADFSIRFSSSGLYGTNAQVGNGQDFANGAYYVNGTLNPSFGSDVYLNVYSIIGTVAPAAGGTSFLTLSSTFMSRFYIGNIAEFLYYPGGVTTSQRQQVEGYLAHKWGLNGYYDSSIPLSIPGCQFWLDAADPNAMTLSGTSVITVLDKSGNGKTLSGGSGWSYNVTKFNGTYPSFYRATTGSMLGQNTTFSLTSTNITLFFVGMLVSSGSTTSQVYFTDGGEVNTGRFYNYVDYTGGLDNVNIIHGDTRTTANYTITNRRIFSPFIFSQSAGTSPQTGTINGTTINGSDGITGSMTVTGLTIGGPWNNLAGALPYTWPGHICETIIYNIALTTTQRQSIEGYLARKWGLTSMYSALPSIHPFSSIRPHLRTFQPTDIPGCQLWLDAADNSTLVLSGSNVTSWNDKSGKSRIITINSAPTYVTTGFNNSYPHMNFVSGNNLTLTIPSVGTSDIAIFAVWRQTTANTQQNVFSIGTPGGTTETGLGWNNGENRYKFYRYAGPQSVNATTTNNQNVIGSAIQVSGVRSLFINGNTPDSTGTESYNQTNTTAFIGGGTFPLVGQLAELIFYIGTITTIERQQVEGYLAHKWGLTPYLPVISPLSIPGCQLWLDGADPAGTGVTPSNGATVSTWVDKATAKNAAATGTPTYVTGGGVNFNGSSYFLNQTFTMNLSQRSIFIVMQETTHTDFYGVLPFIPDPNSGNDSTTTNGLSIETKNGLRFYANSGGYTSDIGNTTLLVKAIYNDNMNITTGSGYLNGTNATNVNANYTAGTCSGYGVGGRWLSGSMSGSYRLNGIIYEIIVFNTALTTTQRQSIEGYLARKWGISISATLPSLHPFKSILPAIAAHFYPTDITGCQLWLDAADIFGNGTAPSNGATVSTWTDKSGKGYNAVTYGAAPTYVSNKSIQFTGPSNTNLRSPVPAQTFSTGMSLFVVFVKTTGANTYETLVTRTVTGEPAPFDMYNTNRMWGAVNNYISGTAPSFTTYTTQTLLSITMSTSLNWLEYINGTNIVSYNLTNIGNVGTPTWNDTASYMYIGTRADSITRYTGQISEVIAYNSILSTEQRQQVEGYLAHKWGLVNSLPSKHPYKPLPPIFPPNLFFPTPSMYSALFSSANNPSLTIPANAALTLGTNDHTIEFWLYQTSRAQYDVPFSYGNTSLFAQNNYFMSVGSYIGIVIGNGSGNWAINIDGGALPSLNEWHHYAFVRNGTTFTFYLNGINRGSATSSVNIPAQGDVFRIGNTTTYPINGYISNFRLVNGTAVYTSNFTPPTTPLTAIPNTQILLQGLVDRGPNAFTVTNNGSVTLSTSVSPF